MTVKIAERGTESLDAYRAAPCLLLVHSRGSGAKLGMDYKRVEVTTKVVVEGDLDKEFGGEWEKYEATAWSL